MFAAGKPRSIAGVRAKNAAGALSRRRTSNVCLPGTIGSGSLPDSGRRFKASPLRLTPSTSLSAGSVMTCSPPWLARTVNTSVEFAARWPIECVSCTESIARVAPGTGCGRVTRSVSVSPGSG